MSITVIIAVTVTLMTIASVIATRAFPDEQVPMQWGLRGQVNWHAPRRWAFYLAPAMSGVVLILVSRTTVTEVALVAITMIAVHALHLWMAFRSA